MFHKGSPLRAFGFIVHFEARLQLPCVVSALVRFRPDDSSHGPNPLGTAVGFHQNDITGS